MKNQLFSHTSPIFLSAFFLLIFFVTPIKAYAFDFYLNPNPVVAGKPVTISIAGCSEQAINDSKNPAGNAWGPVFAYQQVRVGVGWTAIEGKFDSNGIASRQFQVNDTGTYNFRFSCSGEKGKDPTKYTGQGTPDLHDYIGGFDVKTQDEVDKANAKKYKPVCKLNNDGICQSVNTSIGEIDPDPVKLITRLMGVLLGLSGGIFLLLIIRAGYRMISSQGNPEAIKDARESLTSAVVGFLFLIFSFVILELIGVHILQLPGFSQ